MFHQGYSRQQILLGNPRGSRSTYKTKGRTPGMRHLRRERRCLNGLCEEIPICLPNMSAPKHPGKRGEDLDRGWNAKAVSASSTLASLRSLQLLYYSDFPSGAFPVYVTSLRT
jgi:hypothetical protein